jgi:membrane protein implicated in regulation of membrane protease activity
MLNYFKKMSKLETVLAIMFVLFVILPIEIPDMCASMIDSTIGLAALFGLTVYMFFHLNPVLAVLFVFVAYELLKRSSNKTGKAVIMRHTPSQEKKDVKMKKMNPIKKETLEEEVVDNMAPVGRSDISAYVSTSFSPVAEDVGSASKY